MELLEQKTRACTNDFVSERLLNCCNILAPKKARLFISVGLKFERQFRL